MTQPKPLSPRDAAKLVQEGAVVVDIREASERETGVIPDAAHVPLSEFADCLLPTASDQPVIFHCKTGGRTAANAAALARKGGCQTYLLQGGIDAWAAEGFPVEQPK